MELEDLESVQSRCICGQSLTDTNDTIVKGVFNRAFDAKVIQQDVDQIVAITLSRAGYERRRLEAGSQRKKVHLLHHILPTCI